jgi:predicted GNAT family acetyltransferase
MANLKHAHNELFRRGPDECFASLEDLWDHCRTRKRESTDRWHPPQLLKPQPASDGLSLAVGSDGAFALNDWSFSQLCRLAGINKDTVNRLTPETASRAFAETLPSGQKPLQILTTESSVRSIHGVAYTRLWDADLIQTLREFATDFEPPQKAFNGGTGLYCGEQDMFCFLIDPLGWTEIGGENFAPGFFVWNSEVGKRSVGMSTFWFQAVCQNHIVWDAVDVTEFSRKHTASVHDSLSEVRRTIEALVQKRDARKDGFAAVMRKAMSTKLGQDADEVEKVLAKNGIARQLAKDALKMACEQGRFTIWAVVDALTRLTGQLVHVGDRTEADQKAASLLALAV